MAYIASSRCPASEALAISLSPDCPTNSLVTRLANSNISLFLTCGIDSAIISLLESEDTSTYIYWLSCSFGEVTCVVYYKIASF